MMIADSFGVLSSPVEVLSSAIDTSSALTVPGSSESTIIRVNATPSCWLLASGVANWVESPANVLTGAARTPMASAAAMEARAAVAHADADLPDIILTATATPAHVVSRTSIVPPQLFAPIGAITLSRNSFCNPTTGPVIHPTQFIETVQSSRRHSTAMTMR